MVAPLFVIAYFMDKTTVGQKLDFLKKPISYSAVGRKVELRLVDVLSGITFFLMGLLILYLTMAGKLAMQGSEYQMTVNIYMENITSAINLFFSKNPAAVWIFAILIIAAILFRIFIRKKKAQTKV